VDHRGRTTRSQLRMLMARICLTSTIVGDGLSHTG
jgi:hypothetical protein